MRRRNLLGVVLNPRVIFTGPTLEREPIKSTIAISVRIYRGPTIIYYNTTRNIYKLSIL
jgi:hypothetical protein